MISSNIVEKKKLAEDLEKQELEVNEKMFFFACDACSKFAQIINNIIIF
jgi:hypothetical protein